MEAVGVQVYRPCFGPSDQRGSSKPPLSSSAVTSRILLRQQLMREQLQEQERREHQRQRASQYQQTTAGQTPAINVSVPVGLPPASQVPMEVLKVNRPWFVVCDCRRRRGGYMAACIISRLSEFVQ
ncbi:microphthalmia-associated transcription factor-like [Cebidichthys violaceus]|uniref:microphthalmia-associated transcription factor-like n=1 Tax=Cebidichthys violaceus TaxID=271503 RepID=UPI0035CBC411